ncbi:HAD family phosphatase [Streptomyces sp. P38-E01]|uniref:HAD family phosphatase n=1 Tax=Streptomyces tardus TaxID=2780544 RepID=A0A949N294_9ACTN|nr:HAD family phosphatase [Streptomyces tardus]MBU7598700.1 HAD family phosphatase [Streptomyces tardus]
MPTPPDALLCDMDGTLVDTEASWLETVDGLLHEHGEAHGPEAVRGFAGLPLGSAAQLLAVRIRRPVDVVAERLHHGFTARVSSGVRLKPGAAELLDRAAALGVPVALVTASERAVTDQVLRTLGAARFALSVANGETARGKPHPDPYLAACRLLGAAPGRCLAVEDTPVGVRAALAAGCRVLAVPTVPGIVAGGRTTVVGSLREIALWDFSFD